MKPEDSARLAREAVMGNTRGIREDAVAELRRIIDEQAAEIARLEESKLQWVKVGSDAAWSMAEQLIEERAKREASERIVRRWEDKEIRRAVCCNNNEERAEKAEARVKELENVLHHYAFCPEVPGGTPLEQVPECLSRRVAELQGLVDAVLPHCYARGCDKLATHSDPHLYGDYACDEHAQSSMGRVHYAKYVIALARDLAAKEKEPTR